MLSCFDELSKRLAAGERKCIHKRACNGGFSSRKVDQHGRISKDFFTRERHKTPAYQPVMETPRVPVDPNPQNA